MTVQSLLIILALAGVTYATRFGGHVVLARFGALHQRVEAGLDAVPGAVLAALVAPGIVGQGAPEFFAAVTVVVAGFRLPMIAAIALALAVLVALRSILL